MSSYGSWSVKGIDDRARAVAKEKARLEGVTLGDYINSLLLNGHSEAGPRDAPDIYHRDPNPASPLDGLTRRIEAAEARSTLAITGIDQSVLGLLTRLENTEHSSAAMAAEVESMVDELRETHEALQSKVEQIETDDTAHQNLQAMKALEHALGKLATHVYEESGLTQDETGAIKGRMEAGFTDLNERVEGMECKVESTLSDAAKRVEQAVQQSELRAEGTSRHLSERFTAIESGVAAKLAKVDQVDARMSAVEGDVSGAITSMEGTVTRIQDRLTRAENTTDAALKALEQTFASLDERIESVAVHANPERAEALRQQYETRFEGLAADLRASIDETRAQLATEIEQAAAGDNPELTGRLETTIDALKERLSNGEQRSSRALEAVSLQVGRISTGLDTRLRNVEEREDHVIEQIGARMDTLAANLDQRVAESEQRSASAIEQVGEQVAGAINRVQARQETSARSVEDTIAAANQSQEARLSQALSNISERLSDMQTQTASVVSPVQKAIASLAARLEVVEDFTAPPHVDAPQRDLPDMPELEANIASIEAEIDDITVVEAEPEFAAEVDTVAEPDEDADFIAGLPEYDAPAAEEDPIDFETGLEDWGVAAETATPETEDGSVDVDYTTAAAETEHEYRADIPAEADSDPLAELASNIDEDYSDWDDGRDEARDSDIFADDFPETETDSLELAVAEVEEISGADAEPHDPLLEIDEDATDYLARARRAAIAAASEIPEKKGKGRRSAAWTSGNKQKTTAANGGIKGSSKMPVLAAASALAIATAGAGAYVAMQNGQTDPGETFAVASVTSLKTEAETTADTPSLSGVDYSEEDAAITAELFEEEGSVAPVETTTTIKPAALPIIPKTPNLRRTAFAGDGVAQYQFGEKRLGQEDYSQGSEFIKRAAKQGLPAAQYRLGKLHEKGLGLPRDPIEARVWIEKAARGGNVKAMHDLAVFYVDGKGGPQSYAGAADWFRKAADFGLVDSQYNLAVLYQQGLGISPSLTEALYWYEIAARNGDASAPGSVSDLRDRLSLEDAQTAQRRAATWAPAAPVPASNGKFEKQSWQTGARAQILAVQTVLNGLGYETGKPDGVAGPGTRTAIREFQADAGLPTTGKINDALVEALNKQAHKAT